MRRAWQWGVGLMLVVAGAQALPPAEIHTRLHLAPCGSRGALCGRLARPLDETGAVAGTVQVAFELYPARGPGQARGTLVAAEGGPGFPTTGSRDDYLALYAPLLVDHDLVLMDNRGTGRSGALDCPPLRPPAPLSVATIGACGEWLGPRAPLYGTAAATDDLEAILAALGAGRVDLYGDSYGTFFAQVFGLRHPQRLRSLVLDGAYPLTGPDIASMPAYAPAMRAKFDLACSRSPRCAALPGPSMARLGKALELLRLESATAPSALATTLFGNAPAFATLRDADAAARALLAGDPSPLARLMAEAGAAVESRDPAGVATYSGALAAAVTCNDTPQVLDMRLPPAERHVAGAAAMQAHERDAGPSYAPFTLAEFLGMPVDYAYLEQCGAWPVANAAHPPAWNLALDRPFPSVPVLVLSGELDNITSPAEGSAAAAFYPHATHVVIANSGHVNALPRARSNCGARLVRAFVSTLEAGDTRCASAVPAIRLAPAFVRHAADVEPAQALPGNDAGEQALRLAAAALYTAGDLLARPDAHGSGLRGGNYASKGTAPNGVVHLDAVRWCEDLAVYGELRPGAGGAGRARLNFVAADGTQGSIDAEWPAGGAESKATLTGAVGGLTLRARLPAP